jgi:hypothetical protein
MLCDQGEFKKSQKLLQPLCNGFEGMEFASEQLIEAHSLLTYCQSHRGAANGSLQRRLNGGRAR